MDKAAAAVSSIRSSLSVLGTVSPIELDVTSVASIIAAVVHVDGEFGRLDVLTNNAAIGGLRFTDKKLAYDAVLATNVTGPALVADAFRPLLLRSSNAYSVFVSSGQRTLPRNCLQAPPPTHGQIGKGLHMYQVSKVALNMLTVLEARERGEEGAKVFAMSPGFVVSNLRGTSEEARTGWGKAADPECSGKLLLSIVNG